MTDIEIARETLRWAEEIRDRHNGEVTRTEGLNLLTTIEVLKGLVVELRQLYPEWILSEDGNEACLWCGNYEGFGHTKLCPFITIHEQKYNAIFSEGE